LTSIELEIKGTQVRALITLMTFGRDLVLLAVGDHGHFEASGATARSARVVDGGREEAGENVLLQEGAGH